MARFDPKKARRTAAVEWAGGRFAAPGWVTGEGEPYRPTIVVWIDVTEDALVYAKPFGPESGPPSLAAALEEAMANPMDGRVRKPTGVRVARADYAAELRARFSPRIGVVVGPTPEVGEAAELLAEQARDAAPPQDWLAHLRAGDPAVTLFFERAPGPPHARVARHASARPGRQDAPRRRKGRGAPSSTCSCARSRCWSPGFRRTPEATSAGYGASSGWSEGGPTHTRPAAYLHSAGSSPSRSRSSTRSV